MNRRKFVKTAVMASAVSFPATTFGFSKYQLPDVKHVNGLKVNDPILRIVDLNIGENVNIILYDGSKAQIKLLSLKEDRDPVFNTLTGTQVKVEINGVKADLECKSYRLPVQV